MKINYLAVVISLIISSTCLAGDWGDLPNGYTWQESKKARIAIPLPSGWHVKEEDNKGTIGLFLSKEDINAEGSFMTGYTLNYIEQFTEKAKSGPAKYAVRFIMEAQKKGEIVKESWVNEIAEGITGFGLRYRDLAKTPTVLIHYFLIADENEDSLRIIIFEAPESNWDEAWKHGELMLSKGQLWKL